MCGILHKVEYHIENTSNGGSHLIGGQVDVVVGDGRGTGAGNESGILTDFDIERRYKNNSPDNACIERGRVCLRKCVVRAGSECGIGTGDGE